MKISENWLREWVSPKLTTTALAERLTLAGLEVGGVEPVAALLGRVVVGEILGVAPHPRADRLTVCEVDVGKARPRTIVCAAPNTAAGMKVPTALPGAVLPGGAAIKQASVRGVASSGMLCSAAELGLEGAEEGLLRLDGGAKPGMPIYQCLDLDDCLLDLDLTPNRGDCLSIGGVAREVSVLTGARIKPPRIRPIPARTRTALKVTLETPQDCPHYVGRVIEEIDSAAQTPMWMRERLRRAGQRSISPVVDITNYVMLELGQPMHAFDLATLSGGIVVRQAKQHERLVLLDGKEIALPTGGLVIADQKRPLALGGIIGGMDASVGGRTHHIFLESAYFRPQAIAQRAQDLGLQTESSHRFERGVDPALQRPAMERATTLLLEVVGGRPGPVIEAKAAAHLPKRPTIRLRHTRIERLLGLTVSRLTVERILRRLGMRLTRTAQGWRVIPPSYRFDIERECDLIEEVARVHGYNKIPSRAPHARLVMDAPPEGRITARRLRDVLIDRDYQEVITYSFVSPELEARINPALKPAALRNPISADMAVMRSSLWPGLLQTLAYNMNRQHKRIRLFEIGRVFEAGKRKITEEFMLGGVVTGAAEREQWGTTTRIVDFYDIKADVEALLALTGRSEAFYFEPAHHPALRPGQAATIRLRGQPVGRVGALHPDSQGELDIDQPTFLFELRLETLQNSVIHRYEPISRYPAIRRDLAVVVAEEIPAQQVLETVSMATGKRLKKLELFDVYRGKGIDSKRKSLAFGLTLQDSSRTLRDEEVEEIMVRIVSALQAELGAELRN